LPRPSVSAMVQPAHEEVDTMATPAIRVAVADERRMIAEALAALIGTMHGFAVSAVVVAKGGACITATQSPDLVLAGVASDSRAGFSLVRSIRARFPDVEIVLVADALKPDVVRLVFEEGLGGLLLTDMSVSYLATALDEIAHRRSVMPAGWQRMLADSQHDRLDSLSDRQLEVLRLLADGCSYEEIGARLFITLNTVKYHVRSIFVRLGVGNRMQAARVLAECAAAGSQAQVRPASPRSFASARFAGR
jgi:DNA-binding NarL/FixJ family response regulator